MAQGWTDALRQVHPKKGVYFYWDFALRGGYDRSSGLQMDHLLLNPSVAQMLRTGCIDQDIRGWEKRSDPVLAWIELDTGACLDLERFRLGDLVR